MGWEVVFLRVLVVDDERPCLDELVYMLSKQENVEIAGAFTSPLKALEALAHLKPDTAFLDLSMPHMNGAELVEKMLAQMPDLKIVFVTAYGKELAKLREISVVGSLLKPMSEAKLRELLRQIVTK